MPKVWKDALGRVRQGHGLQSDVQAPALKEDEPGPYIRRINQTPTTVSVGAAPSSRAGGYNPPVEELVACDPDFLKTDFSIFVGKKWSVLKALGQLRESIILDAAIFIANETLAAFAFVYWRPVMWSMVWVFMTIGVSCIGLLSVRSRHSFGLIMFIVLQLMFSIINLAHANMAHAEAIRGCHNHQREFQNCNVDALKHCILQDQCKQDEMRSLDPPCLAPGQAVCEVYAHMDIMFWANQIINFYTYSEPCWWALIAVCRLEISSQSEGPNTTVFRRLLRGKDLPDEAEQQGYNGTGMWIIAVAAISVGVMTIIGSLDGDS